MKLEKNFEDTLINKNRLTYTLFPLFQINIYLQDIFQILRMIQNFFGNQEFYAKIIWNNPDTIKYPGSNGEFLISPGRILNISKTLTVKNIIWMNIIPDFAKKKIQRIIPDPVQHPGSRVRFSRILNTEFRTMSS